MAQQISHRCSIRLRQYNLKSAVFADDAGTVRVNVAISNRGKHSIYVQVNADCCHRGVYKICVSWRLAYVDLLLKLLQCSSMNCAEKKLDYIQAKSSKDALLRYLIKQATCM